MSYQLDENHCKGDHMEVARMTGDAIGRTHVIARSFHDYTFLLDMDMDLLVATSEQRLNAIVMF